MGGIEKKGEDNKGDGKYKNIKPSKQNKHKKCVFRVFVQKSHPKGLFFIVEYDFFRNVDNIFLPNYIAKYLVPKTQNVRVVLKGFMVKASK